MKLAVGWFRYEPQWKGNRALPEAERLSLEIRRLRPVDLYSDDDDAFYTQWRDDELKPKYGATEYWPQIARFPVPILGVLRRLTTHTRNWQGFEFEHGMETDPIKIALEMPTPPGLQQSDGLLWEITTVLTETANLTADEVKNYKGPSAGMSTARASTAPSAPAVAAPSSAGTRPAPTATAR